MGLHDHLCDSCTQMVDVLFPIAMLDELPTGGTQMVQRWYCVVCYVTIGDEAEEMETDEDRDFDDNEEEEEEEVQRLRTHSCGCMFQGPERDNRWKLVVVCKNHWGKGQIRRVKYECGCIVEHVNFGVYTYLQVCVRHV